MNASPLRSSRLARTGLAIALAGLSMAARGADDGDAAHMRDFMIMDVCLDAQGKVMADVTPGQPQCTRRRDVKPGEAPPYRLHNFIGAARGCTSKLGNVAKENVPVTIDGVTRIVSSYDKGSDEACDPKGKKDDKGDKFGDFGTEGGSEGLSMQWYDKEYAFIMGSWSPVATVHWVTPNCKKFPDTSQRYFRGWTLANTRVGSAPGYVTSESKLMMRKPSESDSGCPERFSRSFNYWYMTKTRYTGGQTLDTLVSTHFPRASKSGAGPAESEQMERTYWTREFGLTRWEKWADERWTNPRNKRGAKDLGESVVEAERCSSPAPAPGKVSAEFSAQSATDPAKKLYVETHNVAGLPTQRWVMTICNDFSNVQPRPAGQKAVDWKAVVNPAFWRE